MSLLILVFLAVQTPTARSQTCCNGVCCNLATIQCLMLELSCTPVSAQGVANEAVPFAAVDLWFQHVQETGSCPGTRVPDFYDFESSNTTVQRLLQWYRTQLTIDQYEQDPSQAANTFTFARSNFMSDFTDQERVDSLGDLPIVVPTVSPSCPPTETRKNSRERKRQWWWDDSSSSDSPTDDCDDSPRRLQANEAFTCSQVTFSGTSRQAFEHSREIFDVHSQGSTCGSCWAFSAVGSAETTLHYQTGGVITPSEQQILDCSGAGDCSGGKAQPALEFIAGANAGMCDDAAYGAYSGVQGVCSNCDRIAGSRPQNVYCFDATPSQLELALHFGVPTISMEFPRRMFSYGSGVFQCSPNDEMIGGHALILVGHGFDASVGRSYFRVKNQWTKCWGENGYARIDKGTAQHCKFYTRRQSAIPDYHSGSGGGAITIPTNQCRVYLYPNTNFQGSAMGPLDIGMHSTSNFGFESLSVAGDSCCRAVVSFLDGGVVGSVSVGRAVADKGLEFGAERPVVSVKVTCEARTESPTKRPTSDPTGHPSIKPSRNPTARPSWLPSPGPVPRPSKPPRTWKPTKGPVTQPAPTCDDVLWYLRNDSKLSRSCMRTLCHLNEDKLQQKCVYRRKDYAVRTSCAFKNFMGVKKYSYMCECMRRLEELQDAAGCSGY